MPRTLVSFGLSAFPSSTILRAFSSASFSVRNGLSANSGGRSIGVTVRKSHMPSRLGAPQGVLSAAVFFPAGACFAAGAGGFDPVVCAARDATPVVTANTRDSLRSRIFRTSIFKTPYYGGEFFCKSRADAVLHRPVSVRHNQRARTGPPRAPQVARRKGVRS